MMAAAEVKSLDCGCYRRCLDGAWFYMPECPIHGHLYPQQLRDRDTRLHSIAAIDEVSAELERAQRRFGPMASAHEGIAVIHEEFDELLAEVRSNKRLPVEYRAAMRLEAVQLAAMALRFIVDVCDADA